jgi:hypothetical protein
MVQQRAEYQVAQDSWQADTIDVASVLSSLCKLLHEPGYQDKHV